MAGAGLHSWWSSLSGDVPYDIFVLERLVEPSRRLFLLYLGPRIAPGDRERLRKKP